MPSHIGSHGNWIAKGNHLSFLQCYDSNRGVPFTELHYADASKELLEVHLYDLWVGGLTQDLKQVLITDEEIL